MDLDELAYVFGWIRRLSKAWTETERQSGGGRRDNRDRGSERTGRRGDKPRSSGIGEEIEPIMTGAVKDSLILSFSSSLKLAGKTKGLILTF